MDRTIVIFLAALTMLTLVLLVPHHQASKFDETYSELKSLNKEQIESIQIFETDFPIQVRHEITNKSDIGEFLNAIVESEEYSPGKRATSLRYSAAIILKPQEIHMRISDSENDSLMVNGNLGKFKEKDHYSHYGSFQISGLVPWVDEFVLQNGT